MFSRVVVACAAALPAAVLSISVTWAADPTTFFEKSTIVGAGETITLSRVPVRNSAGAIKYYDATIEFSVDAAGKLTQTALPTFTLSPSLIISNFKAGTYTSPASGPIAVAGPGVGGPAGQAAWTVQGTSSSCTAPPAATWYTGSIATNPLKARLQQAGITQTQYSYGIVGNGPPICNYWFQPGNLIGAQQVGNTLTLVSFTWNGSQDYATPQAQITFTLKP